MNNLILNNNQFNHNYFSSTKLINEEIKNDIKYKRDIIIMEQYRKFNEENKDDNSKKYIEYNFIDELISCNILIYFKFEKIGLFLKDIYKYEDIKNENIEWKVEENMRIPYLNNKKILAIQFDKNNLDKLINYLS